MDKPIPLVVDVDGTLINGDLLAENISRFLRAYPLGFFHIPWWLMTGGLVGLKRKLALAVPVPPKSLLYHAPVLEEMTKAKGEGRPLWLASGSEELHIAPLASHVGADNYCATDGKINLLGPRKAKKLTELFGEGQFDYIGNERMDVPIWKVARRCLGIGLGPSLEKEVRHIDGKARFFPGTSRGKIRYYLCALRPYQWTKNLLVFLPLLGAHDFRPEVSLTALMTAALFSLSASGIYLWNDFLDMSADRVHPSKKNRPVAKGLVPPFQAIFLGTLLIFMALVLSFFLSLEALACVLLYISMTMAYSLFLKRQLFMDVVVLDLLFTLRVAAGGFTTGIPLSPWMLAFSLFIFLSLGIVKCMAELHHKSPPKDAKARDYSSKDLPVLTSLATASGLCSIVVLALYIQGPSAEIYYDHGQFLWALCPSILYWIGRMILLASRGQMDDDPVLFALRDQTSWIVGLIVLASLGLAIAS